MKKALPIQPEVLANIYICLLEATTKIGLNPELGHLKVEMYNHFRNII